MNAESGDVAGTTPRRGCLECGHPLAPQRPVFLVGEPSGRIMGPFHAGCAERVVLRAKKKKKAEELSAIHQLGIWPSRREEEVP